MSKRDPVKFLKFFAIPFIDNGTEWLKIECPSHNDKHESLNDCHGGINKISGAFKCLSCGAGGTMIKVAAMKTGQPELVIDIMNDNITGDFTPGFVDPALVEIYHQELMANSQIKARMAKQHGIVEEDIKRFRLGYYSKTQRITIPIKDSSGTYCNMRQYRYDAEKAKVIGIKGGKVVLWPLDALKQDTVYITEGEFKAVLLTGKGYNAITGTGGANTFKQEWAPLFKNKHVILLLDVDEAGRKGSSQICHWLHRFAASIKNVFLKDVLDIPKGDITNYFVDKQRTVEQLNELVNNTEPYQPPKHNNSALKLELNEPIELKLSHCSKAEYNHKIVETIAVVSAKDTAPYIIPKKCTVMCAKDRPYCTGCIVFEMDKPHTFEIEQHSPAILDLIGCSGAAQDTVLKHHSQIYHGCKAASFRRDESHNVEEIKLIPQIAIGHSSEELVTRKAFHVYEKKNNPVAANNTYKMKARVCAEPKDGHATLVAYTADSVTDDLDNFTATLDLSIFNPTEWTKDAIRAKLDDIYEDLETNVTKIYLRRDLHIFYDLVWHSCLYVPFQCRQVKGWADALVIGDSGQGKSECSSRMSQHYKCGERVDTKRASVAGIVGGLQETSNRWFITWGTIPLNDRRLVILEEIKGMGAAELSKMTDMRSSGVAELTKIERARTNARTRLIWISNPRSDSNLSAYNYGVDAVRELIGAPEDIRRFDMVMAVATGDVAKEVINSRHETIVPHIFTSEYCAQLINWAWSRSEKNIIIECEDEILACANRMAAIYSSSCPIVEPADQRLKLLRLAVALAARTYSTEDGESLIVRKCHIEFVEDFLNGIYSSKALGYRDYSETQKKQEVMKFPEKVRARLSNTCNAKDTVRGLIETSLIRVEDLMNLAELQLDSANDLIGFFVREGCVTRSVRGGFKKTGAFITLLKEMDRSGTLENMTAHEKANAGEM